MEKKQLEKILLEVRLSNTTARKLYENFGFEDSKRKKNITRTVKQQLSIEKHSNKILKISMDWLVQAGFLGDIVINTAAFKIVRGRWPDKKQVLITTAVGKAALGNHLV